MVELFIGPAVLMGIVIGFYEAYLVHNDEGNIRGSMKHAIHTIPVTMILVFVAMNVDFVVTLLPNVAFFKSAMFPHILRAAVGIFAMLKLHGVSAIAGNVKGMQEKWMHSLVVAGLIVATPYIFIMIEPALKNIMPASLKFLVSVGGK
jgi:hypothetical protein